MSSDPEDTNKINDMVEEIVDKLEFLGVGLEAVSPVKTLAIQTQVGLLPVILACHDRALDCFRRSVLRHIFS